MLDIAAYPLLRFILPSTLLAYLQDGIPLNTHVIDKKTRVPYMTYMRFSSTAIMRYILNGGLDAECFINRDKELVAVGVLQMTEYPTHLSVEWRNNYRPAQYEQVGSACCEALVILADAMSKMRITNYALKEAVGFHLATGMVADSPDIQDVISQAYKKARTVGKKYVAEYNIQMHMSPEGFSRWRQRAGLPEDFRAYPRTRQQIYRRAMHALSAHIIRGLRDVLYPIPKRRPLVFQFEHELLRRSTVLVSLCRALALKQDSLETSDYKLLGQLLQIISRNPIQLNDTDDEGLRGAISMILTLYHNRYERAHITERQIRPTSPSLPPVVFSRMRSETSSHPAAVSSQSRLALTL